MVSTVLELRSVGLRDLLPGSKLFHAADIPVTSCCSDSRSCQPGDLFVAQVGSDSDGHFFVGDAIERGATAILAEQFIPTGGVPLCVVPDTRRAFGVICQALAGNPSQGMDIVGVTGTNGKTTTCCLIQSIFNAASFRSGITGTLGYCDGKKTVPASLTTPDANVLANFLGRMHSNGCTHGVVEVSSHALAQGRTAGIELDVACVTNVRRDHLDFHSTQENYRRAKQRIFDNLRPEGVSILNLDDVVCRDFVQQCPGPMLTVGIEREAELTATIVERFVSEQTFLLHCGSDTIPVRTRIIGTQHVYNCLTAAAVGLAYDIDLPTIVRGLETVDEMPGRLQRIECGQPFHVFVDYAHTPDALRVSLGTLRSTTQGRIICVFGAGGDRDRAKRSLMGREVAAGADIAVVTDDNPRTENSMRIIEDILTGMDGNVDLRVLPDRAAAIEMALGMARPGDAVLVAGKGHENYQIVGQQRSYFDDREVVRGYLFDSTSDKPWLGTLRKAA